MDQPELINFIANAFDRHGIVYAVTGSHAGFIYGEHRFTNDIDVVAQISAEQLARFLAEFPADQFYVSEIGAQSAVVNGGQFNIIHPESGNKVDVIIPADRGWPDQFARRQLRPTEANRDVWFVSPEDLILRKMDFYRMGESERHLRDIASILKVRRVPIDRLYIARWAESLHLQDIWDEICRRVP